MSNDRIGGSGTGATRAYPSGRQLAAIFGAIAISWLALTAAGRVVVRLIYEGKAPAALNSLMTNRGSRPVSDFYEIADDPILALHFLLAVIAVLWLTRSRRSPGLVLGLLLIADVGLLLMDIRSRSVLLTIWHDWSVPEWFCYFEELLFAALMYRTFRLTREKIYACLSLTGLMFFVDDIGRYHELMGRALVPIVEATRLHELLRVESHYLGEILSLAPYGLLALAGLWFYRQVPRQPRRDARIAACLIALLFVFGVVVDLVAHLGQVMSMPEFSRDGMAFTEDFGEMLIQSSLAAFAAAVFWRSQRNAGIAIKPAPTG